MLEEDFDWTAFYVECFINFFAIIGGISTAVVLGAYIISLITNEPFTL